MKKGFLAIVLLAFFTVACGTEDKEEKSKEGEKVATLEICDCIIPTQENEVKCAELYPNITDEDLANCGVEVLTPDTVTTVAIDSAARDDYENDLSLEIKEIVEEIENPISEDCKLFLEDYADGIKSFARITEKVASNPDDIGLQIQMSSAMDDINGWATKPQMFQCSQNEAFQKQIEILNNKKDKLLEI